MESIHDFLFSWNCIVWLAISGAVTGLFAVIVGIFDKNTNANVTALVGIIAFAFGAIPALFSESSGFMEYLISPGTNLWVMTTIFVTFAISSVNGALQRKGQGWKFGLMGLLAFHFGMLAVFFPIF